MNKHLEVQAAEYIAELEAYRPDLAFVYRDLNGAVRFIAFANPQVSAVPRHIDIVDYDMWHAGAELLPLLKRQIADPFPTQPPKTISHICHR